MNGVKEEKTALSMLLPHEMLHALATCNASVCFESIMFGNMSRDDVAKFWRHVEGLEPWKNHPVLLDPTVDKSMLVPIQLHADGAEMFRDDECFCFSWSSAFATSGLIADVMLYRFPLLLIQERHMKDDAVSG